MLNLGEKQWCEPNKGTSEARGRSKDATIRPQAKVGQQLYSNGVDPSTNGTH